MTIVIFGASGDLAKRKLFPSLSLIKPIPRIIAYSRSDINIHKKISEFHSYSNDFQNKIEYLRGEYTDLSELKSRLTDEMPIFYFSVPPSTYKPLLTGLKIFSKGKIAIEKPFAFSLSNYNEIINNIPENFELFLIDHYLLKPMSNFLPEITLDSKTIKSIKIISKEEVGIEGRSYFDDTGIIKDILQNHLFIICYKLLGDEFINSQVKECVIGQYIGYANELGKESNTETLACITLNNKSEKYKDIDFLFFAGKGMNEKRTEIRIKFKKEFFRFIIENLLNKKTEQTDSEKMNISNATINTVEETVVNVNKINDLELIINFAPRNNVFLNVHFDKECKEYVIVEKDKVMELFKKKYGALDDHALIFDSLINGNKFECTEIEIVRKEWEIFDIEQKKLIYYEKGIDYPDEIKNMFDDIDK